MCFCDLAPHYAIFILCFKPHSEVEGEMPSGKCIECKAPFGESFTTWYVTILWATEYLQQGLNELSGINPNETLEMLNGEFDAVCFCLISYCNILPFPKCFDN